MQNPLKLLVACAGERDILANTDGMGLKVLLDSNDDVAWVRLEMAAEGRGTHPCRIAVRSVTTTGQSHMLDMIPIGAAWSGMHWMCAHPNTKEHLTSVAARVVALLNELDPLVDYEDRDLDREIRSACAKYAVTLPVRCGLNADWNCSAWHFGPSLAPNRVSGDVYVLDTEFDNSEDAFIIVQRHYSTDGSYRVEDVMTTNSALFAVAAATILAKTNG
jgi:hypothetical protein